jgi:hypothetical protein
VSACRGRKKAGIVDFESTCPLRPSDPDPPSRY